MLKVVVIAVNTNGWLVQIILSLKIENWKKKHEILSDGLSS
jgi:hypothetical protein